MSSTFAGLVVQEQSGFFWVERSDGEVIICRLRGKLMEEAQSSDIAAIGDRVTAELQPDGTGAIESVEERTSVISRAVRTEGNRGAGYAEREHVLMANAEQAIFVFAASQPPPNLRMLDRFLVVGERGGLDDLVIVLNKIDLDTDGANREHFRRYENIGYTILHTSARESIGIDTLRERLQNRISLFTGPSGVGKTSLLNAIEPGLGRTVKAVSASTQEGMHTTRDSHLVKLATGGYLADTPGIRNLTLWDMEPEELDGYFREIAPLVPRCKFKNCTHLNEPGCAVKTAVEKGTVLRSRYDSYRALRAELDAALEADY